MNIRNLLKLSLLTTASLLVLTGCKTQQSDDTSTTTQTLIQGSKGTCDVNKMATMLASGQNAAHKKFSVKLKADKDANYDYYSIVAQGEFNADSIRRAVCGYINENHCYVYWGNVASIAMISNKKAPVFPTDTSPHYVLSEKVTCSKFKQ